MQEKAANLLYLITKNHTFIDGNKRIASTLFIYFLEFYNILYKENRQVIDEIFDPTLDLERAINYWRMIDIHKSG